MAVRALYPEKEVQCPVMRALCPDIGVFCPATKKHSLDKGVRCPVVRVLCPEMGVFCPATMPFRPAKGAFRPAAGTRCPVVMGAMYQKNMGLVLFVILSLYSKLGAFDLLELVLYPVLHSR